MSNIQPQLGKNHNGFKDLTHTNMCYRCDYCSQPYQNIVLAIHSFLPYLTNDDLDDLVKTLNTLKDHRRQKEYLAKLETMKHSWPYHDTAPPRSEQIEND